MLYTFYVCASGWFLLPHHIIIYTSYISKKCWRLTSFFIIISSSAQPTYQRPIQNPIYFIHVLSVSLYEWVNLTPKWYCNDWCFLCLMMIRLPWLLTPLADMSTWFALKCRIPIVSSNKKTEYKHRKDWRLLD